MSGQLTSSSSARASAKRASSSPRIALTEGKASHITSETGSTATFTFTVRLILSSSRLDSQLTAMYGSTGHIRPVPLDTKQYAGR